MESYKERIRRMRALTQHNVNVLHVYCRLVDAGVKRVTARRICCFLERSRLYHLVYVNGH